MTAGPRCTKYKMICLCLGIKVKPRFCKWKQVLFSCNLGHPDSPGLHQHYQVKLIGWYWHGNCFSLFNRPGQQYSKMSHFKISLISKLKMVPESHTCHVLRRFAALRNRRQICFSQPADSPSWDHWLPHGVKNQLYRYSSFYSTKK